MSVILFYHYLLAVSIPDPKALYPFNSWFTTREIDNEQPSGTPVGVTLAVGPNNNDGGSYQFHGSVGSYIEFPNNGGLDVQHSITILCWLYLESVEDGPIFSYGTHEQVRGVYFWISNQGNLYASYAHRNYSQLPSLETHQPLALNKWHFVGTSYDHDNGIASIWLNGERVVQQSIGAGITLATQDNVRMGAKDDDQRHLLGRIAAIQVFDAALTARQILEVKENGLGRHLRPLQLHF